MISYLFHSASHTGNVRKINEDRLLTIQHADGSLLLAVADGMGGMAGGDLAASLAAKDLKSASRDGLTPQDLQQAATRAHESIRQRAATNPALDGMGTTLTAALLRQDKLYWVHAGDSRAYRLRGKKLEQLTTDHRFFTSMLQAGDITMEEAQRHPLWNVLEQCLGGEELQLETGGTDLSAGDVLLLCTDGLHDEVPQEILQWILSSGDEPETLVRRLLQAALEAGGKDNVSLIAVVCGKK